MKRIKLILLALPVFVLLFSGCNKDDTATKYAAWKVKNDTYFTSMKDSTSYTLYTIPAERGGGSFYYKVTQAGGQTDSVSPQYYDFVVVNYRGKLIDGTVFDQTFTGNIIPPDSTATSAGFYVIAVIPGWIENLSQMKVGETRKFVLPQELAYGATLSGSILPYSVTTWEVVLVKIYRANPTQAPTLKSTKRNILKGFIRN